MTRGREEERDKTSGCNSGDIDIPLDVTVEILKKVPTKSLMRFQCVSKVWSSVISSRRDFIDSIIARSLTQPHRDVHCMGHIYSSKTFLALFSTSDKELVLVPGEYHQGHQFVRGLICSWSSYHRTHKVVVVIYNPTTRQSLYLPELKPYHSGTYYFGYDPIENQYKVLFLPCLREETPFYVFTLGDPMATEWRNIEAVRRHDQAYENAVCINGTIYFRQMSGTSDIDGYWSYDIRLMGFDVRSEKFYHVDAPKIEMTSPYVDLTNYQGKLGFISCRKGVEIWVMEETQRWSKIFFCEMDGFERLHFSGVTRCGEIVFADDYQTFVGHSTLCVYYYDPKLNSMRCVDLEDCYKEKGSHYIRFSVDTTSVLTVPDYVQNTMRLR